MINRVIEWSAAHRAAVVIAALAAAAAGWWSMQRVPLDAIPDLGETQVIVYARWDRSPDVVEAQVTSPIVTALVGAPRVKAVRGISDFGYSFVYVIFNEGTDLYWARSRTLEYLSPLLLTFWVQSRTTPAPNAGTSVTINDTAPDFDRWNLAAVEIVPR